MSKLLITDQIEIPLREISFHYSRSSGSGGQNVNKVNTKVLLRWIPLESSALPPDVVERLIKKAGKRINSTGALQITSQRYRDQGRNVADCLEKLRTLVAACLVKPKKRIKTKRTKASNEKRLAEKRQKSLKKKDRQRKDHDG